MTKATLFAICAIIGIALGLYFAQPGSESPTVASLTAEEISQLESLRSGDMLKLQITPDRGSAVAFIQEDGTETTLAAYQGKWVLLNFWATWCAPCRKEMPHLSALQTELGGDTFQVVTIATGVNQRPAMERFLSDIGVDNLPLHTDPNSALARDFGVVGLPVTLILNPEGQETARLIGDADWTSESAMAILQALIDS